MIAEIVKINMCVIFAEFVKNCGDGQDCRDCQHCQVAMIA